MRQPSWYDLPDGFKGHRTYHEPSSGRCQAVPQSRGRKMFMFGMLDYRAYKLFWLVTLPLRVMGKIGFYVCIFAAIVIAQWTGYDLWLRIVVAYVLMELFALVLQGVWFVLGVITTRIFFWFLDVIPGRGANNEEALAIAAKGPRVWLTKKLTESITEWTDRDTEEFAGLMNWRARWFFDGRGRVEQRVQILKRFQEDSGRSVSSLSMEEARHLIGHLEMGPIEKIIVSPFGFNSLMGFVLIVIGVNVFH
jgi:hypothetical protein